MIFLKENNQDPITFRIIHSPHYGEELHLLSGHFSYREVRDQAQISAWKFEEIYLLFVKCSKDEVLQAFEKTSNFLLDRRSELNKKFIGDHDLTGSLEY